MEASRVSPVSLVTEKRECMVGWVVGFEKDIVANDPGEIRDPFA